jgi:predicted transcriptional regulator of viral defense system
MRVAAYVPQQSAKSDRVLSLARELPFVRPRDVEGIGVAREYLLRLHRSGQLERVGRGLYRLPNLPVTEHHNFAQVARRVSQGVICLLSALAFHDVGTQNPFEVWIAIPRGMRHPKLDAPPLRVTTLSGASYAEGIEEHMIEGVTVRIYGIAKTVVDCFRFRNKIGLDVAMEALRESLRSKKTTINEINRFAKLARLGRVMRPYLEAL